MPTSFSIPVLQPYIQDANLALGILKRGLALLTDTPTLSFALLRQDRAVFTPLFGAELCRLALQDIPAVPIFVASPEATTPQEPGPLLYMFVRDKEETKKVQVYVSPPEGMEELKRIVDAMDAEEQNEEDMLIDTGKGRAGFVRVHDEPVTSIVHN